MRTIAPQTPPDFRPPVRWTPPAHVPADSAQELEYRSPAGTIVLVIVVLAMLGVGGGIMAAVAAKSPRRGSPGSSSGQADAHTTRDLASITLEESPKELGKKLGISPTDKSLRVPLQGSSFDAITFQWGDDTSHVLDFYLNCPSPMPGYAALRKKLAAKLPNRWSTDEHWGWEDASIYWGRDGGVLSVHVSPKHDEGENPQWKAQSEALWNVVRVALLDLDGTVDAKTLRDALGGGAPLTDLPKIAFEADIDGSRAAVNAVFPGATMRKSSDLYFTVALDHPFLGKAELQWPNKKGGKLKEIELWPRTGTEFGPAQEKMNACISSAFSIKGEKYEHDYLTKKYDTSFRLPQGGHVRVYYHLVAISFREYPWAGPMKKETWEKLAGVLDACGR